MINELSVQDEHTPVESKKSKYAHLQLQTFPLTVILTTVLDRIKWNSKPTASPPTPPKKVEDEAAQKPKCAIFLSLIGGGGGGGEGGI